MCFLLIFCLTIISNYAYCSYADSSFSEKCYFSNDGKLALVSELDFVTLFKYSDRLPVYGIYKLGENSPNNNIAVSEDSIYFFSDTMNSEFLPLNIDSSFEIQYFLNKYHFILGENVTKSVTIEILEKFLKEVNSNDEDHPYQFNDTIIHTSNATLYDYFFEFKYFDRIIFKDTLLNSHAVKNYLIEGLNEIEKKEIYTDDWELKGTQGYGTRIYSNADNTMFFIRAKYDVSSYMPITRESSYLQIDQISKMERIVETYTTSFRIEDPIELRVLIKSGN